MEWEEMILWECVSIKMDFKTTKTNGEDKVQTNGEDNVQTNGDKVDQINGEDKVKINGELVDKEAEQEDWLTNGVLLDLTMDLPINRVLMDLPEAKLNPETLVDSHNLLLEFN